MFTVITVKKVYRVSAKALAGFRAGRTDIIGIHKDGQKYDRLW